MSGVIEFPSGRVKADCLPQPGDRYQAGIIGVGSTFIENRTDTNFFLPQSLEMMTTRLLVVNSRGMPCRSRLRSEPREGRLDSDGDLEP